MPSSASRCPGGVALWTFDWQAAEGEHVLCSRATDAAGNVAAARPRWNLKGYANNAVERITVSVA